MAGLPGSGSVQGAGPHTGSRARQCSVSFFEHCAGAHLSQEEDIPEVVAGSSSKAENVLGRTHCYQGEPLKYL